MGADQNFSHHEPSRVLGEVWNSYGRAKPTLADIDRSDTDRLDRLLRPVRPVGLEMKSQTGQTGYPDRSDRSVPNSPQPKLQMANLEQTKSKSSETWRIPLHWSREHIPKRSHPKD